MQTTGVFVGTLPEFTAGMEIGKHQFHCGDFEFGMDINGDAAAIVSNGDGAVHMNCHGDVLAETRQVLVDRVVEHLKDTVMQAALIGVADVHTGPFPDGLETF